MFDVSSKQTRLSQLEAQTSSPDFWEVRDEAMTVMGEISTIKDDLERVSLLKKQLDEIAAIVELLESEDDVELEADLGSKIALLKRDIEHFENSILLSGQDDHRDAYISIHPGAGGVDSQDWAEMLLRMYLRWAESNSFQTRIIEIMAGEGAGIKSSTILVSGRNAFGLLKGEKGVHRLVRLSPFDANRRRHTSFASVDVTPVVEENVDISVDKKDLKIETYRSSGAGGQHVNVTDSAVRITHIPTGTVVQCQNERSQIQNRDTAMKVLVSKLYEREMERRAEELEVERGLKKEIAWGSQIRSYVLHPYQMVKDHRTQEEVGNIDDVLNGNIDIFINAYLRMAAASK
ncbi:MAG: peptide chain release factor 2 [Actinobacteria bacterium]|nr:peptide chain release factor 2 [Actinomycetota bacterium]